MTTNAANEKQLALVHKKVAEVMYSSLLVYDRLKEIQSNADLTDEQFMTLLLELPSSMKEVNPALLSVITKFLKDNDISCPADESADMSSLEKRLANKQRKVVGNITHIDENE